MHKLKTPDLIGVHENLDKSSFLINEIVDNKIIRHLSKS